MSEDVRDLTDEEARRALPCKWGQVADGELPAWVAEMDYAVAAPIRAALQEAVADGTVGYPSFAPGDALARAYAGFARRQFGHRVDPGLVVPVCDVTSGLRLVLDVLCEDAPVVVPTPAYPPLLDLPGVTGRGLVPVPTDADAPTAGLDLAAVGRALASGARTVLLTQPQNPLGHVYSRTDLEGLRDLVAAHGARVLSDEVHGPLVLPGASHVPYLSLEGTAEHAVSVVSASKSFNVAGLRCAQVVLGNGADLDRLLAAPSLLNDAWSPLGVVAAVAAYTDGDPWLAALRRRLDGQRRLLADLLAEHLPKARMRPLEATYLAWLDLRGYGHDDPAAVAREHGRVRLLPGHAFQPGLVGHLRMNIATSPERLTDIVRRTAAALG